MFSLPTGDGLVNTAYDSLDTMLAPNHGASRGITWGDAHDGPYGDELAALVVAAGLENKTTFTEEELSPPNFIVWMFTLVPLEGSPVGSSPDGDTLIISNSMHPIENSGDLLHDGEVFDAEFEGHSLGMDGLGQAYDGFSHELIVWFSGAAYGPPDASLPGPWELQLELIDSTGAGWQTSTLFRVE
jgi:hypothetical protein